MRPVLAAVALGVILAAVAVLGGCAAAPGLDPAAGDEAMPAAPAQPTTEASTAPDPTAAPTRPETPTAQTSQPPPGFEFTIGPVDAPTRAKMGKTWFAGCPVPIEDLRHVTVTHYGFDGTVHRGEFLVAADVAESLREPFRKVFELRYPIQVLDVTDGEEVPWDESAAFNCRKKVGNRSEWSEHSYGRAIDINPVQNPYVSRSSIVPEDGRAFADRSRTDAGILYAGDPVVTAFEAAGWLWAGNWTGGTHDYMHFSTTGQ